MLVLEEDDPLLPMIPNLQSAALVIFTTPENQQCMLPVTLESTRELPLLRSIRRDFASYPRQQN